MAERRTHKVVEKCEVGPARSRSTSLPLSFLDLPYARRPVYVKRLFFYDFPHPTHVFYETTLPSLKHALSLTLQHFFPLAGNLLCQPPPHKPFIRCTDDDSVTLSIVESQADFNHLSSYHPKKLKDLDHLVPALTFTTVHDDDDTYVFPLVALQVTVFPNHGLCIAITNCHVIMDGRSCCYFIESWSAMCRSRRSSGGVEFTPPSPCFDREMLKDPKGLEAIFLRDYFQERSTWKDKLIAQTTPNRDHGHCVKATVAFGRDDIEGMKRFVLNQCEKNDEFKKAPQYLSKFVVTCAFVWVSWVKAKCRLGDNDEEDEQEEYFRFAADCRDRFEYPIPATYVGNCIARCLAVLKRKDLVGEGGFVNAVKAIARVITDMKTEPLKGAENWMELRRKMFTLGSAVLVAAGSPKFSVYETDFGFGRPTKVEMVVDPISRICVALAESGDKEGGLELGFVFTSREQYEYFISVIETGLVTLKS